MCSSLEILFPRVGSKQSPTTHDTYPLVTDILNLPQQFAQSPMGQMLMPMIRQFTRGGQLDPASMVGMGYMISEQNEH